MEPFAKIDLSCDFAKNARKGPPVVSYGSIRYYRVLGNPFPFEILKLWKPDAIRWVEVDAPARPHRDHSVHAAVNCYFDPSGARTTFWTEGPNSKPVFFPGASTANIYEKEGLIEGPSFIAQPGESYIMDNSQIHSVDMELGRLRRFIQLSWTTKSFNTILEMITGRTQPAC